MKAGFQRGKNRYIIDKPTPFFTFFAEIEEFHGKGPRRGPRMSQSCQKFFFLFFSTIYIHLISSSTVRKEITHGIITLLFYLLTFLLKRETRERERERERRQLSLFVVVIPTTVSILGRILGASPFRLFVVSWPPIEICHQIYHFCLVVLIFCLISSPISPMGAHGQDEISDK